MGSLMDRTFLELLRSLPRLNAKNASMRKCKVCGRDASLFDVVDFNKFCGHECYAFGTSGVPVYYFRCPSCEFLFTDFCDEWGPEDYSHLIYNDDYAKVDPDYLGARPIREASSMRSVLKGCESSRLLDYGSGSGIFAEEMTRIGFSKVSNYDPFSSPTRPSGVFDIITCFEVIEHSPDPIATLHDMMDMLSDRGAIFVGQTLQPFNIEEVRGAWWYLAPRNGHISTYSDVTFSTIAHAANLHYYRGNFNYVFARTGLADPVRRAAERIGPRVDTIVLFAPKEGDFGTAWHKPEKSLSMTFRWSALDELRWEKVSLAPSMVRIRIPYVMEIAKDFAKNCKVFLNDGQLSTFVASGNIVAETIIRESDSFDITLRTPPPVAPKSIRISSDERLLGLAVEVA